MTRILSRLTVTIALLAALAGCSTGAAESPAVPTAASPEWLFAVQSTGISTVDVTSGTVSMPTEAVEAFTNRPIRESRTMDPSEFAELWSSQSSDSFAADPPNAVLTYWTENGSDPTPHSLTCEVVDAVSYAAATGHLQFTLRPIDGSALELPARLLNASLFIDDTPICVNSPDDEAIVEYVNQVDFETGFGVQSGTDPNTGKYAVVPTCPERESSTIPPSDMDVRITLPEGSTYGSCYTGAKLEIAPDDLAALPSCSADGQCTFTISVLHLYTYQVYTETTVSVRITTESTVPVDLNPATLPLCPNGQ